jgi:hypothetical protein
MSDIRLLKNNREESVGNSEITIFFALQYG